MQMKCPVCDVELNVSERHGIEIDYCPKCRGVWLDRGELDKIIERASRYEADRYHYSDDHEERYHRGYDDNNYYKKRSFWGEIFDFD